MPLRSIPVRQIISSLTEASNRFLDPASPARKIATREVASQTGFSEPTVEQALDWTFSEINPENLRRLLVSELGSEDAADDPALPSPRQTLLIAAGTIFQPAVNGVVFSLLIKSPIVVKCSSHEQALLPLFVRTLREIDPDVGGAAAVTVLEESVWTDADAVVVYGSDETISAVRSRIPKGGDARFIGHGHKISVAVVGGEALQSDATALDAARDLALDVAMYDQSGCLSPHCAYVETGGAVKPEAFAERLAGELESLSLRLPPGRMPVEQSAAVQTLRAEFEFRGGAHFFGNRLSFTVVVDPDPSFRPSPLGRTVFVKPIVTVSGLAEHLKPLAGHLQGIGAAPADCIRNLHLPLRALGASYFCPLGRMQRPPLDWQNGGVPCLKSLLK